MFESAIVIQNVNQNEFRDFPRERISDIFPVAAREDNVFETHFYLRLLYQKAGSAGYDTPRCAN